MLNLTHIPPRAHTYLANLSLMLGGLMPVAFLTHLPGTLSLWTVEKRWIESVQKLIKFSNTGWTKHQSWYFTSLRSGQTLSDGKTRIQLSEAWTDKSTDSGMATHLISCWASNDTTWLFRLSPPSAHHFLINMLSEAHKVKGGQAAAAFRLWEHVEICPLTNKWSERLAKSNILFKQILVRWGCSSLLPTRNRKFSAGRSSSVKAICGITQEQRRRAVGGGVKLFIGCCVNRNVSISHSSQHLQSMKNHTNHTSEKLVETL